MIPKINQKYVKYFLTVILTFGTLQLIHCEPQIAYSNRTHQQIIVPATVIERSEPLANGCYNQTIKEPDHSDLSRFIYTEQLICPPGVNMTAMTQHYARPQTNSGFPPTAPADIGKSYVVLQPVPTMQNHSAFNTHYQNQSYAVNATPPLAPAWPAPMPPTAAVAPPRPIVTEKPNTVTSQVMVLSQKTGQYAKERKANTAANLFVVKTYVIVVALFLI
uniref:Uncharacterized protein n=1 Tax=Musca domestica TaxID=7370 RepID=A0A1I8MLB6_MUSDO